MKYRETAKRLLFAMASAGMSQQELSNLSGISKSSISHYVNGSHEPGNKAAYAMANALAVDPLWLMGLDIKTDKPSSSNIRIEISDFEEQIILAFRTASDDTKAAVCAVLGIKGDSARMTEESTDSSKGA
jgi:transcriptional regulator with XRE-family HTH domain